MQDLTLQDLTLTDQITGVDIARPDIGPGIGRPNPQGWTLQDLTMADQISGVDIARSDFGRPKTVITVTRIHTCTRNERESNNRNRLTLADQVEEDELAE